MRVLVTSTEGAGHLGPLLPFVEAVGRLGGEVRAVVPPALVERLRSRGLTVEAGADPPAGDLERVRADFATLGPEGRSALMNGELFGRLCTAALLPAVGEACRRWVPDLVLHEAAEYAGALAAHRLGLAHAQVAISTGAAEDGSLAHAAGPLEAMEPGVAAAVRASPYLSRFPASLDGAHYPDTRRYHVPRPPARPLPGWWPGRDGPLVYVTLGTVTGALPGPVVEAAYRTALAALSPLDVRVLVTAGGTAPARLGPLPANVHLEPWVDHDDVVAAADVVVSHGGSGTTLGTVAAGVPQVLTPMFADQPANARLVAAAGAGVVVAPEPGPGGAVAALGPGDVARLRRAVVAALDDHSYRQAAGRLAAEMAAYPSTDEVVAQLVA